ncbi:MAG: methyltransferase [Brevundimonas sp.]|nr:MAG: methyltransferase [Brevundimonas sp.]
MRRTLIAALFLTLAAPAVGLASIPPQDPTAYAAALADSVRTDADRERDATRHTAETLAFAEVAPGQKVADMIIGGGYFTRAFAAAVGPSGHVTAWQPAEFIGFQASYKDAIDAADALANVDAIRSPIAAPAFPTGLDLIFTAQNYHDLHLTPFGADTASKVNAAAFAALKPGGLYVIIDHHAVAGSGLSAANDLHRIDIEQVKREVTAAGFVLDGETDILANTTDPRTANVFDASIRGHTSQFALRFRKPR